jgi:hypothetical protein
MSIDMRVTILIIGVAIVIPFVIVFRDKLQLDVMLALLAGLVLAFLVRMGSNKAQDVKDRYGL